MLILVLLQIHNTRTLGTCAKRVGFTFHEDLSLNFQCDQQVMNAGGMEFNIR